MLNAVRRVQPVAVAALVTAVGLGLVYWTSRTDIGALRYRLIRWQFWALEAQFVLFAVLTCLNLPGLIRMLALRPPAVGAVASTSLLSLIVIATVVPQTNRIFYDEHIYQGIGQNLSDLHLAQTCNEGTVEYGRLQCASGEYNKQPYGYPYLLSLLYRIGGVHEFIAHWFNATCAGLLVWVVFITATALWGDQRLGGFAALLVALIPEQLRWSRTASAEPSAALMASIAVMAAVCFVRMRTLRSLLWMAVATVFATQFRPECLFLAVVVVLLVTLYARDAFSRSSWWWATGLALALFTANLQHLFAVRGEAWGAPGDRMSLAYFWPNLQVNGLFFLDNARFPALYTALALYGLAQRPTRATITAVVYFLLFWGVFLFFYAGSYDYGADVRFSLMSYPAAAMLAGLGAARLHDRVVAMGFDRRAVTLAIASGLGFQFLWFMPQIRSIGEEGWAARADVEFARRASRDLPPQSIVLTHNPHVFLLAGISAAQISLGTGAPDYVTTLLPARYAGGIFVHWNYWCNVDDPPQQALCKAALGLARTDIVREYKERNYRYAFYRLDPGEPRMLLKTGPR